MPSTTCALRSRIKKFPPAISVASSKFYLFGFIVENALENMKKQALPTLKVHIPAKSAIVIDRIDINTNIHKNMPK